MKDSICDTARTSSPSSSACNPRYTPTPKIHAISTSLMSSPQKPSQPIVLLPNRNKPSSLKPLSTTPDEPQRVNLFHTPCLVQIPLYGERFAEPRVYPPSLLNPCLRPTIQESGIQHSRFHFVTQGFSCTIKERTAASLRDARCARNSMKKIPYGKAGRL